jgi:exopolysaccharide biosynthesis polyprenyl glycosylphosphotransferase
MTSMGDSAKLVEFRAAAHGAAKRPIGVAPDASGSADFARVLPGASWRNSRKKPQFSVRTINPEVESAGEEINHHHSFSEEVKPRFLERLRPAVLPSLVADVALICTVYAGESRWLSGIWKSALSLHVATLYLFTFIIFAIEEKLYSTPAELPKKQAAAALRALAWASFFSSFSLQSASFRATFTTVTVFTTGNLLALMGFRLFSAHICSRGQVLRNVLIVGSGAGAQRIATAIHSDANSGRLVKGFMAEQHLRNAYGPAMLSRVAREQFIDELLVASPDPEILNLAIREARANLLDVSIAPAVSKSEDISLEIVGGIALLGMEAHHSPEYALALKRCLDAALALVGMIVLSPVFIIVALAVKADSRGPILYRAPRIGRKGQSFLCYKFRTMVNGADALQNELRSRNERNGAFFKIAGDPRITRTGRFLRRYSLDELPQLWNVLLGHMSLVGPRPHPPEDVDLYKVQDLQRLDFVPGITGLWQVTARRDPSFEHSVALDVEYIRTWNLWLDLRILWRTIFAVVEGSGA